MQHLPLTALLGLKNSYSTVAYYSNQGKDTVTTHDSVAQSPWFTNDLTQL